jgi:ArsR family transcriptional regulator
MLTVMPAAGAVEFGKAIADATRQTIMRYCCCEWRAVLDIAEQAGVTQPTASHHLAVLREAGLVKTRREGKQIFYTLDQSRIASCCGRLLTDFAPDDRATAAVRRCCR